MADDREPLVMPQDEFAVVARAWQAWLGGPDREVFDRVIQEVAEDAVAPWRVHLEAAEARLAEVRSVLLEGGQGDATARCRAIAIVGTGEADRG